MLSPWVQIALIIIGYMFFWFAVGIIIKDNTKVDVAWGIGHIFLAFYSYFMFSEDYKDGR